MQELVLHEAEPLDEKAEPLDEKAEPLDEKAEPLDEKTNTLDVVVKALLMMTAGSVGSKAHASMMIDHNVLLVVMGMNTKLNLLDIWV